LDNKIQPVIALIPLGLFLTHKLRKANEKSDYDFLLAMCAVSVVLYGTIVMIAISQ